MARRLKFVCERNTPGAFAARISCVIGFAAALALAPAAATAQGGTLPDAPNAQIKERFLVDRFPDKPSLPPVLAIPIEPLGFAPPGAIYLGARNALASLDFLDENRLLFTFRVPGLLHRDRKDSNESDEREIRAIVLTLPHGAVESEATWTVHDRVRYLWPLNNGHFLLRDRNHLLEGDASLALKPYLDFPGSLLWLELDPQQHFLVTNSLEPAAQPAKPDGSSGLEPGSGGLAADSNGVGGVAGGSPATAGTITSGQDSAAENGHPDLIVRILHRESGEVMLVSRARTAVHLPINSAGYLENLRGSGTGWVLDLSYFDGGSKMLGKVDSNCEPDDYFLSDQEILVTTCGSAGETNLVAMTGSGGTLWESLAPPTEVWAQLAVAANGSRLAWETLDTTRPVSYWESLDPSDVKEQSVTVFDAANGDIALVSPVSPILDVGGNVAISPSGRRVALLNDGSIQVFDLPAATPLPAAAKTHR